MNRITLYSKRNCPYCISAEQLLHHKGISDIDKIDIGVHPQEMAKMTERTGRRTVPQIYIGAIHVGGFDDLTALDRAGKLDSLLNR